MRLAQEPAGRGSARIAVLGEHRLARALRRRHRADSSIVKRRPPSPTRICLWISGPGVHFTSTAIIVEQRRRGAAGRRAQRITSNSRFDGRCRAPRWRRCSRLRNHIGVRRCSGSPAERVLGSSWSAPQRGSAGRSCRAAARGRPKHDASSVSTITSGCCASTTATQALPGAASGQSSSGVGPRAEDLEREPPIAARRRGEPRRPPPSYRSTSTWRLRGPLQHRRPTFRMRGRRRRRPRPASPAAGGDRAGTGFQLATHTSPGRGAHRRPAPMARARTARRRGCAGSPARFRRPRS